MALIPPLSISVGLYGELSNVVEAHPGWRSRSVALHADDGGIFEKNGGQTYSTGRPFGPSIIVGCGVDYYKRGEYLFTLDGEIIGKAHPRKRN